VSRIIEQGDVFFFYRPRVGVEEVDDLADVQRFFLILKPDQKRRFRRIILGRKRLPEPREHEREWAFVYEVDDDPAELREAIRCRVYETRTRGVRAEPQARPVGDGRYVPLDDPRFLDVEGTELVLVGAAEDPEAELGVQLDREQERLEHADIFRRLRIRPDELAVEPLARGELR